MINMKKSLLAVLVLASCAVALLAIAGETPPPAVAAGGAAEAPEAPTPVLDSPTPSASTAPADERGQAGSAPNPLRNVYFGEQHLHTANSPDAFVIGVRGTWEDAYNWAMGNAITLSTNGESTRLPDRHRGAACRDGRAWSRRERWPRASRRRCLRLPGVDRARRGCRRSLPGA